MKHPGVPCSNTRGWSRWLEPAQRFVLRPQVWPMREDGMWCKHCSQRPASKSAYRIYGMAPENDFTAFGLSTVRTSCAALCFNDGKRTRSKHHKQGRLLMHVDATWCSTRIHCCRALWGPKGHAALLLWLRLRGLSYSGPSIFACWAIANNCFMRANGKDE